LTKTGFSDADIDAHGRICMEGAPAEWLPHETRTGKRDMVVLPRHPRHLLHPQSRISYERWHPVDYNDPIMIIGQIRDDLLPYLVQYVDDEYKKRRQRPEPGNKDQAGKDRK
jgi:hypothetical protein